MYDFYSVELFRNGDIECIGTYGLAEAYRVFAASISLIEYNQYDSVCIFAWSDDLPVETIAQFSDYDVEK